MKPLALLLASLIASTLVGCGSSQQAPAFPTGEGVRLLGRPLHLGNNLASGQSWIYGEATAAQHCTLVNLPRAAPAHVQVVGLRNTETLSDQLVVNNQAFALPVTLQQDRRGGVSPSAAQMSPLYAVQLAEGPSQICLVAGRNRGGDVDDFEVDEILLFAEGVSPDKIAVRPGLTSGAPAPAPPQQAEQQPPWPGRRERGQRGGARSAQGRWCPPFMYGFSGC